MTLIDNVPQDSQNVLYKTGQIVPDSGVYTAIHEGHRAPHEVVAIKGEEFPQCRFCQEQVRFRIAKLVPHMTHDFDLAGPRTRGLWRRARAAVRHSGA